VWEDGVGFLNSNETVLIPTYLSSHFKGCNLKHLSTDLKA